MEIHLERDDPVEVVTKLKAETDGRLEVAGATLAAPIVQAGLVDEYRIAVACAHRHRRRHPIEYRGLSVDGAARFEGFLVHVAFWLAQSAVVCFK
jgi:riboflavin biosynthesis pyrimidine reductase